MFNDFQLKLPLGSSDHLNPKRPFYHLDRLRQFFTHLRYMYESSGADMERFVESHRNYFKGQKRGFWELELIA
jgi:hypothetical protein